MPKKTKKFIAGGCSFTWGHELSDDNEGRNPSCKSWAYLLKDMGYLQPSDRYVCAAWPGSGNSGIARRVFNAIHQGGIDLNSGVVVMWSFISRYDWAMSRHKKLEDTRWATISPWDTSMAEYERQQGLLGSEVQQLHWDNRDKINQETKVKDFAEAIYRHGANQYHEIYLSWKSIIWLQEILKKHKIPYMFTLADNSLFWNEFTPHKDTDNFLASMHKEIDFTKWFTFGERDMGFNQWAMLNDYERGTTHPLDKAHKDAVKLMKHTFFKLIGEK